eukprot:TRINITY_DN12434_c0_g1_i1.p1 TRINITY_DN12434_c0_g1~~TRINITY_DN12434_c0_g1_i1.p1  ORF type:complete len:244 (-),score=39.16 TRINITY_DN12434_c0_g1_i1:159-890(-)
MIWNQLLFGNKGEIQKIRFITIYLKSISWCLNIIIYDNLFSSKEIRNFIEYIIELEISLHNKYKKLNLQKLNYQSSIEQPRKLTKLMLTSKASQEKSQQCCHSQKETFNCCSIEMNIPEKQKQFAYQENQLNIFQQIKQIQTMYLAKLIEQLKATQKEFDELQIAKIFFFNIRCQSIPSSFEIIEEGCQSKKEHRSFILACKDCIQLRVKLVDILYTMKKKLAKIMVEDTYLLLTNDIIDLMN